MNVSVRELVDLEWRLLGEGPQEREGEPEAWERFAVSRSSELAAWPPELRESWRKDLLTAQSEGRNPMLEKSIYVLERTEPGRFDALKGSLPGASMEKLWLVDWICQAQTAWQEPLAEQYPCLAEDPRWDGVPYEADLRGGLMACSVDTLRLYASQVERTLKAGGNLCETILENTARLLGFSSPEAAERSLAERREQLAVPV